MTVFRLQFKQNVLQIVWSSYRYVFVHKSIHMKLSDFAYGQRALHGCEEAIQNQPLFHARPTAAKVLKHAWQGTREMVTVVHVWSFACRIPRG